MTYNLAMVDLRFNRYQLSPDRSAALIRECIERVDDVKSGLGVIELHGSEDASDIARAVEREVFDHTFGDKMAHTPEFMTHEYGPWEGQSSFYLVLDMENSSPIGTVRVIKGLPNKTTVDLAKGDLLDTAVLDDRGLTSANTWDITSLAVTPFTRAAKSRNTTLTLFRCLYVASLAENVKYWTTIIDDGVIQTCSALGMPFVRLEEVEPLNYLGTDACTYLADVDDVHRSMTSRAEQAGPRVARRIYAMLEGAEIVPEMTPQTIVLPDANTADSESLPSATS